MRSRVTPGVSSTIEIRFPVSLLNKVDTKNVEDMSWMFAYCKALKELDLREFNINKVQAMTGMFSGCELLAKLEINNWDLSKVEDVDEIFDECKSLDLSKLNLVK